MANYTDQQRALLSKAKELKLEGFIQQLEIQFSNPEIYAQLPFETREEDLFQSQDDYLRDHRKRNLLKLAKLKSNKTLAAIETVEKKGLTIDTLHVYTSLSWINGETTMKNICISGASGSGKTSLICAIGRACIEQCIPVLYFNCNDLLAELVASDPTTRKRKRQRIAKAKVLILDDLCLKPQMTEAEAMCLYDILEDRNNESPTIFATQLKQQGIKKRLNVSSVADSICRRLYEKCYVTCLKLDNDNSSSDVKITPDDNALSLKENKEVNND